jgi:hypothetical protein
LTRQNFEEWRSKLMSATGAWSPDQVPRLSDDYDMKIEVSKNLPMKTKSLTYTYVLFTQVAWSEPIPECLAVPADMPSQMDILDGLRTPIETRARITRSFSWSLSQSSIASFALDDDLSVGQLYPPYFLVWGARAVYFGKYLTCLAPRLCFQVPSPEPRSSMIFSTRSEKAHIDPKFVAFEIWTDD